MHVQKFQCLFICIVDKQLYVCVKFCVVLELESEAAAVIIHQKEQSRIFRCQDHHQKRHQICSGVGRLMKYTACIRLFDATYDLIGKRYGHPMVKMFVSNQRQERKKSTQKNVQRIPESYKSLILICSQPTYIILMIKSSSLYCMQICCCVCLLRFIQHDVIFVQKLIIASDSVFKT